VSTAGCDSSVSDRVGHGTAIAGVIAARRGNDYRIAGIDQNTYLMNLKMLGGVDRGRPTGRFPDAADALRYAAGNEAAIATAAWGGESPSLDLWNALLEARAADVLVVAAAGNDQADLDGEENFYPASFKRDCVPGCPCLDNLLVVGATRRDRHSAQPAETKASFSNHGPKVVELGAPGVGVTTTSLERPGGIDVASGTSLAAAIVAGAAALVAETLPDDVRPPARFRVLRDRLLQYADAVPALDGFFDQRRRLNVCRAVYEIAAPDSCPE
jgi:subtilisin family serine protease